MKYLNILLLILIVSFCNIDDKKDITYNYILNGSYVSDINVLIEKNNDKVLDVFYGTITAYEPSCSGCIGITASGYDVRDTFFYNDKEYGNIRIVAMDKSIPFYSIVRISNLYSSNDIVAIVLDRGGAISFDGSSQADLLFSDMISCNNFGKQKNIKFEILRYGY